MLNDSETDAEFPVQLETYRLPSPVYALDTNKSADQFAFGLETGQIFIINYSKDNSKFTEYSGQFAAVAQRSVENSKKLEIKQSVRNLFQFFP